MKQYIALLLSLTILTGLCACSKDTQNGADTSVAETETEVIVNVADSEKKAYIEETLNLANNENQEWTYSSDAWVLSVVSAVAYPELPDQQGVSVCVPGVYVTGIDTNGDGSADVTSADADEAVKGALVIDYDAKITSTNGQVYTAATAPVVLNTGAAGYGSQNNSVASTNHAADGYINVSCGNRGKQDSVTDENGNTVYTGDAPSCLVDQKAAARYVKYNILLGNLPGNVDYFVSTGGSGGGAHATMFAATGNNSDYYDYQIEAGAVGVYTTTDGGYTTVVTIDGKDYEISDGAWGCIAYSAITSLYDADMALAFEYNLNTEYSFKTSFQAQLAEYLSVSYMEYINGKNLSVNESDVGFDLDGDGALDSAVALTIEYDLEAHPETNGYYGTYLDLYMAEFTQNLQWYLDNLDYAEGWTWFDEDGNALTDDAVAAMTSADKAQAFIEGRYTKANSGGMGGSMMGGMMGGMPGGMTGELPDGERPGDMPDGMMGELPNGDMGGMPGGMMGELPNGELPGDMPDSMMGELPNGELPGDMGSMPNGEVPGGGFDSFDSFDSLTDDTDTATGELGEFPSGDMPNGGPGGTLPDGEKPGDLPNGEKPDGAPGGMEVGTPDGGTTQSNTGIGDSGNYETYDEMVAAYKADIEEVYAGDEYGNNIVELYNPLNYIGAEGTDNPTWTKIIMGASEGDISMLNSLNLQIAWLNAGVDAEIEWQWDGGHVPSEVLGESFSLYLDQMYGEYVDGAVSITKSEVAKQTENGTSEEASGKDISSWASLDDSAEVSFTLADIAAYRTAGASKAMPAFDVIDYGQEDYVFGSSEKDARHWNKSLLEIFEEYEDVLEPLFNNSNN